MADDILQALEEEGILTLRLSAGFHRWRASRDPRCQETTSELMASVRKLTLAEAEKIMEISGSG